MERPKFKSRPSPRSALAAELQAQKLQEETLKQNREGQLGQGLLGAAVHATDMANKIIFDAFAPDE